MAAEVAADPTTEQVARLWPARPPATPVAAGRLSRAARYRPGRALAKIWTVASRSGQPSTESRKRRHARGYRTGTERLSIDGPASRWSTLPRRRGSKEPTAVFSLCPRQDSNLRHRLRRAVLYPLSYEGGMARQPYSAGFEAALRADRDLAVGTPL